MNLVHPITALYWGPVWLLAYFRRGRPTSRTAYPVNRWLVRKGWKEKMDERIHLAHLIEQSGTRNAARRTGAVGRHTDSVTPGRATS